MGTALGSILGALFVIYNTLPVFGVHVNPLPDSATAGIAALVAFLGGLFTKTPPSTDPIKTAAALKDAEQNHAKAVAALTKETGVPPGTFK